MVPSKWRKALALAPCLLVLVLVLVRIGVYTVSHPHGCHHARTVAVAAYAGEASKHQERIYWQTVPVSLLPERGNLHAACTPLAPAHALHTVLRTPPYRRARSRAPPVPTC